MAQIYKGPYMFHSDSVLKTCADTGLRTAEDWVSLGRDVVSDAKPRMDTLHRGVSVSLYSRDQTQRRGPSKRRSPH